MKVTVIVPTVTGREASLQRTLDGYRATATTTLEMIVLRDRPSCGHAWNEGAALATGDFLHVTADDLEPHAGWLDAALECVEGGALPSPLLELPWGGTDGVVGPDGEPARMTPMPFLRTADWPGLPDIGYWSDYAVSDRLLADGHTFRWCHGYRFTHHRVQDQARRRHEARFMADRSAYELDRHNYRGRVRA